MQRSRLNSSFLKHWPLVVIVVFGAILRLKDLNYQSLWLDELHTMNEADPSISWQAMFQQLKCCDPHPPLHFIVTRICFSIFGHTEVVARMVTALAGIFSILAMYWLGRELRSKNLGLIAALLTSFNYYNLFYSQEARVYIFAFLFSALSYLFFIRLARTANLTNALGYGLMTLGLLYSHYYSLFVVASQAVIGLYIIFKEPGDTRLARIKWFVLAAAIIIVGYLPWLPFLSATMNIKSFWIIDVDHYFMATYFKDYFGNGGLLTLVLVGLLLVYLFNVSREIGNGNALLQQESLAFSFVIITGWIFITMLIPYIRSVTKFPMLYPRYGIVILPAFILALSYGIDLFRRKEIKIVVAALVTTLSLIQVFAVKDYYSAISKSQFREITQFIIENNSENYPIVNEKTFWHQGYYLNRMGSKAEILKGAKNAILDSVAKKASPKYDVKGFWIVGAHGDPKPSDIILQQIDSGFILVKGKELYDAWAWMYVSRDKDYVTVPYTSFDGGAILEKEKFLAIWNGAVQSKPVQLSKGKYEVFITGRGDPGGNEYPHVIISVNGNKLGDYFMTGTTEQRSFLFEQPGDGPVIVKIEMDNDYYGPGKGDRNVFISQLLFLPLKAGK